MADDDASKVPQLSRSNLPEQRQSNDVAHLAKRLYGAANSVAQALLPVIYLRTCPSDVQDTGCLAQKAYALTAILLNLLEDLALEDVTRSGSQNKDMWTKKHYKDLVLSMEKCHDVFIAIARTVRSIDENFHVRGLETGKDYIDHFHMDEERHAQDKIETCFRLVVQTRLMVKHTALARCENLNNEEIKESLRLTHALQQLDLHDIWALKNEPLATTFFMSIHPPAAPSIQPPTTSPESSTQDGPLTNHSKHISTYGSWPPFGDFQHPEYVAAMTKEHRVNDKNSIVDAPLAIYCSTSKRRSGTGQSTGPHLSPDPTPKAGPGSVTFGQPSIIKSTSSEISFFKNKVPSDPFANWKPPGFNAFTPAPHLEAYIIRPTIESTDTSSILSYTVNSLRLSEEVLRAQVRSLGPNYSIVDALLDLPSQQMDLIQSRAARRLGNIVSVEYGKPITIATLLGPLLVKPVMFIISTTTILPQEPLPLPAPVLSPAGSNPKLTTGLNIFRDIAPTPGFKLSSFGSATGTNHHLSSPEAYSKYLQEKGELCTYVDSTELKGLQHYQTITANKDWHDKDRSCEEIRLADYEAGRKGPMKTNGISYPWDPAPSVFGRPSPNDTSQSVSPTQVKLSKTGWFPTTIVPSAPGFSFGDAAPRFGQPTSDAIISSKPSSHTLEDCKNPRKITPVPSAFGHLGSNLPHFIPPKDTRSDAASHQLVDGVPPLFGGNACNVWRASSKLSSEKDSVSEPKPPFGPQSAGSPRSQNTLFGGTPYDKASSSTTIKSGPSIPQEFGLVDQTSGTVPAASPAGGLFGGFGSTAPESRPASFGRPSALQDYQRQLKKLEEQRMETVRAEMATRMGAHDGAALTALLAPKEIAASVTKEKEAKLSNEQEQDGLSEAVSICVTTGKDSL